MCFDLGFLWPKRDAQIRRENSSISWEYKKSDLVLTRVTSLVSHLVSGSVDGAGALSVHLSESPTLTSDPGDRSMSRPFPWEVYIQLQG